MIRRLITCALVNQRRTRLAFHRELARKDLAPNEPSALLTGYVRSLGNSVLPVPSRSGFKDCDQLSDFNLGTLLYTRKNTPSNSDRAATQADFDFLLFLFYIFHIFYSEHLLHL